MAEPTSTVHVLYHANCMDGLAAAGSAFLRFGDTATYRPCSYNEGAKPLEEIPDDAEVYVLDFSFKKDVIERHIDRFESFLLLDHHVAAKKELEDFADDERIIFDMDHSGAFLAFEHFFIRLRDYDPPHHYALIPLLIRSIEDRDLWKFQMPETKAVAAALRIEPQTVENFARLISSRDEFYELKKTGEVLLRQQDFLVKEAAEKASPIYVTGSPIMAVNTSVFQSEIGHEILKLFPYTPYAACYTVKEEAKGEWWMQLSLRSEDARTDVSEIARSFGGGGHRNAAGCRIKLQSSWA